MGLSVCEQAQDEKSHGAKKTVSATPRTHISDTETSVVNIPPVAPSWASLVSGASNCSQPPRVLPILEAHTVDTQRRNRSFFFLWLCMILGYRAGHPIRVAHAMSVQHTQLFVLLAGTTCGR